MRALLYGSVKHAKVCFGFFCIAFEKLSWGKIKFLFGRTSREIVQRYFNLQRNEALPRPLVRRV